MVTLLMIEPALLDYRMYNALPDEETSLLTPVLFFGAAAFRV